jgi:hypothetical protein
LFDHHVVDLGDALPQLAAGLVEPANVARPPGCLLGGFPLRDGLEAGHLAHDLHVRQHDLSRRCARSEALARQRFADLADQLGDVVPLDRPVEAGRVGCCDLAVGQLLGQLGEIDLGPIGWATALPDMTWSATRSASCS